MIEKPHYQVRAAGLGYIPGLSVLDLIFNLGPEAPLYLCRNGLPDVSEVKQSAEHAERIDGAERGEVYLIILY